MRIKIDEQENLQEIVVTISCRKVDKEVSDIIKLLKMKNKTISGIKENEVILVKVFEILYIESVDKKTFIYTKEDVFQCKEKLYELEEILEKESFIRISKNTIVNLNKVSKIVPDISRRLILTLENKEKVIVSRSFTFNFKKSLGL
ncbi:LytTR family DNA-binding domain-containing protein [Clostridium thermobutyricum]|uniref:Transcriptional regulatory protein YpdB n=1 Tax=Clostridium thermobutyricum DSM 4928 TaxID=1121339 RepID=A0A1V4SY74_9CLOT|nr:LytTR family DNA-binding domain-containing protein [Clostridium thermobutyricum]OPX49770.1 transcriptional regulatory protein YpdB [Clostridium thermobutyricum DSM 4928]